MAKVVELLQWFFFHYASRARTRKCNETKLASSVSFAVFLFHLIFCVASGKSYFQLCQREMNAHIYIYLYMRCLWLLHLPVGCGYCGPIFHFHITRSMDFVIVIMVNVIWKIYYLSLSCVRVYGALYKHIFAHMNVSGRTSTDCHLYTFNGEREIHFNR